MVFYTSISIINHKYKNIDIKNNLNPITHLCGFFMLHMKHATLTRQNFSVGG